MVRFALNIHTVVDQSRRYALRKTHKAMQLNESLVKDCIDDSPSRHSVWFCLIQLTIVLTMASSRPPLLLLSMHCPPRQVIAVLLLLQAARHCCPLFLAARHCCVGRRVQQPLTSRLHFCPVVVVRSVQPLTSRLHSRQLV